MSVSKRTRFEVFKRDGFTCIYCGRKPPEVTLEIDHIIPSSKSGTDDESNLLTSCSDCNRGKSDVPLSEIPLSHLPSLEERREKLDQLKAIAELSVEQAELEDSEFMVVSDLWMRLAGEDASKVQAAGKLASAIRTFIKRLPLDEVIDAVRVTFDKKADGNLKYFCGVCWQKIKCRDPKPNPIEHNE